MWLNLLQRISLIDGVDVIPEDDNVVSVKLHVIPLAQHRTGYTPTSAISERYEVTWSFNGEEQPDLKDVFEWRRPADKVRGQWLVKVHFITPEVRHDPNGYTTSSQSFSL